MITKTEIDRRLNLWNEGYWEVPENLDTTEFNFDWKPDPCDRPYIHQFGTQHQSTGGPRFIIPEHEGVKYQDFQHAIRKPDINNRAWRPLLANSTIDFSWHPPDNDPPYIYVFGNQWYDVDIMPTYQYRVPGATEKKFMYDVTAMLLPDISKWQIPDNIIEFDYSWVPHPYEPAFVWQFGTQWQKNGGPKYITDNAEHVKHIDIQHAIVDNSNSKQWRPLQSNIEFDYSWHPDEDDPPYIYIFGNQWYEPEIMSTVMYRVKDATEKKYVHDHKAKLLSDNSKWIIPDNIDDTMFDYSWVPNPNDPPLTYKFGTQWQRTGGPIYDSKDSLGIKYMSNMTVKKLPDTDNRNWRPLHANIDFDYSWHPDEDDPPYIYMFGNQWYDAITMPTIIYRIPNSTEKKYIDNHKATLLADKSNWTIPNDIDDSMFDYSWVPNPNDPPLVYRFGTQWQKTGGPNYMVTGATDVKYVDTQKVTKLTNMRNWRMLDEIEIDKFDFSWHPDDTEPLMIHEFGTQWQSAGGPFYITKGATMKKYCSDQIAIRKPILDNRNYRPLVNNFEFDYSWHPDPNDPPYVYIFGNQWYPAEVMPTLLYKVTGATEKKFINDVKATLQAKLDNWVIPDDIDDSMFDYSWCPNPGEPPFIYKFGTQWQKTGGPSYIVPQAKDTKYIDLLKVVKKPNNRNWRIIEPIDASTFDFSWHPDETEENYTYVFGNKFHAPEIMPTLTYKSSASIGNKFITNVSADLSIEQVEYEDSMFDALLDGKYTTAYIHFVKKKHPTDYSFLKRKELTVHLMGDDAIVPRNAKTLMFDKLMDYEHHTFHSRYVGEPLDIIFFSNGEACADKNYEHLLSITKDLPNKVIRIDKINGRVASQHAAANASTTPWYFLVNAKLRVSEKFDFGWQPNVYKSRRHYIFTATNPVNNLEYGHQAIIANNKKLTLNTVVRGLDFTMDSRTEVIDINSGVALYNSSEWDTWRTSFRECIKLAYAKDTVSKNRLNTWLTVGQGEFAQYSLQGAKDAVDYYNSVDGDLEKLKLSYDWDWIKQYYNK